MNDALAKIKARIQALLAKANSTEHEAEAEAFLAKANELLREYQLDVADLVDSDDPVVHHVGVRGATSGHAWRWRLYSAVAQLYGCQTIHVDVGFRKADGSEWRGARDGKGVPYYEQRLVGHESAVITTDLMYPWIVGQVRAKAREIVAKVKDEHPDEAMSEQGQAKRVAAALIQRIQRLIAKDRAEQVGAPNEAARNALVVVTNAVKAKFDELYPNTTDIKGRVKTDHLSRQAADSIGLHRQAGGRSQLLLA